MKRPWRIAVADDERDMRDYFQRILPELGYEVVVVAENGRQLIERCRTTKPDLVIADIRMPDGDGLEAAAAINRERPVPVVVVSGYHQADYLQRAREGPVMAYLVKPVKAPDLDAAINLAVARFEEHQKTREEGASLRQALEDRKAIERAKGAVMRRLCVSEEEAYRCMQKRASSHNRKLVDVAHEIISAEEVFWALENGSGNGSRG
jgi:response regulator NasT